MYLCGDTAGTLTAVYKWLERFCDGCESIEDEKRSELPLASKADANVEKLSETIRWNRRWTIREISEALHFLSVRSRHFTMLELRVIYSRDANAVRSSNVYIRKATLVAQQADERYLRCVPDRFVNACRVSAWRPRAAADRNGGRKRIASSNDCSQIQIRRRPEEPLAIGCSTSTPFPTIVTNERVSRGNEKDNEGAWRKIKCKHGGERRGRGTRYGVQPPAEGRRAGGGKEARKERRGDGAREEERWREGGRRGKTRTGEKDGKTHRPIVPAGSQATQEPTTYL